MPSGPAITLANKIQSLKSQKKGAEVFRQEKTPTAPEKAKAASGER